MNYADMCLCVCMCVCVCRHVYTMHFVQKAAVLFHVEEICQKRL
jgi:hypothetical protein